MDINDASKETVQSHLDSLILDSEEKARLAKENINIIYYVVKNFSNSVLDDDEKISAAFLGYAKALDTYRTDKDTKFSTYAVNCVRNEVSYASKKEKRHRMNNESMSKVISVDKNGNNLQLEDILLDVEDEQNQGLESQLMTSEKNEKIKEIIYAHLNDRERYVLFHRFELYGYKSKTQSELASEMEMSQANISKIEKSVLKKLRKYITKEEFC